MNREQSTEKPHWELVDGRIVLVGGTEQKREEAYRKAEEVFSRFRDYDEDGEDSNKAQLSADPMLCPIQVPTFKAEAKPLDNPLPSWYNEYSGSYAKAKGKSDEQKGDRQ